MSKILGEGGRSTCSTEEVNLNLDNVHKLFFDFEVTPKRFMVSKQEIVFGIDAPSPKI